MKTAITAKQLETFLIQKNPWNNSWIFVTENVLSNSHRLNQNEAEFTAFSILLEALDLPDREEIVSTITKKLQEFPELDGLMIAIFGREFQSQQATFKQVVKISYLTNPDRKMGLWQQQLRENSHKDTENSSKLYPIPNNNLSQQPKRHIQNRTNNRDSQASAYYNYETDSSCESRSESVDSGSSNFGVFDFLGSIFSNNDCGSASSDYDAGNHDYGNDSSDYGSDSGDSGCDSGDY